MAKNYLFNGIELPALPEWDKTTYPYAVIFEVHSGGIYICVFSKEPAIVRYGGAYTNPWTTYWKLTDGAWVEKSVASIGGQLVWANHDVYIADNENYGDLAGTLYLAASDPIPVTSAPAPDPTSMLMGWLVGRAIAGQRGRKTPIAYLYNGVQLPALPEWDKVKYPYAVIAYLDIYHIYRVYYCADKCTVTDTNAIYKAPYAWYSGDGSTWEYMGEEAKDSTLIRPMVAPIWANHDIYNGEALYLAASEPVPVYA